MKWAARRTKKPEGMHTVLNLKWRMTALFESILSKITSHFFWNWHNFLCEIKLIKKLNPRLPHSRQEWGSTNYPEYHTLGIVRDFGATRSLCLCGYHSGMRSLHNCMLNKPLDQWLWLIWLGAYVVKADSHIMVEMQHTWNHKFGGGVWANWCIYYQRIFVLVLKKYKYYEAVMHKLPFNICSGWYWKCPINNL